MGLLKVPPSTKAPRQTPSKLACSRRSDSGDNAKKMWAGNTARGSISRRSSLPQRLEQATLFDDEILGYLKTIIRILLLHEKLLKKIISEACALMKVKVRRVSPDVQANKLCIWRAQNEKETVFLAGFSTDTGDHRTLKRVMREKNGSQFFITVNSTFNSQVWV